MFGRKTFAVLLVASVLAAGFWISDRFHGTPQTFVASDSGLGRLAADLRHPTTDASTMLARAKAGLDFELAGSGFRPGATDPNLWLLDVERLALTATERAMTDGKPETSANARQLLLLVISRLEGIRTSDPALGRSVSATLSDVRDQYRRGERKLGWAAAR